MRSRSIYLLPFFALLLAFFIVPGETLAQHTEKKQRSFCSDQNYYSGDKNQVSVRDLREMSRPAGAITVDGGKNGGIAVRGENRSDVLVRACVQASGVSEEAAQSLLRSINIDNGSVIKADSVNENHWSVSYEILVPRSTDLKLNAQNGGISISDVDGNLELRTVNGGLHLKDIGGSVTGRTTNGGLHVTLAGGSWRGSGLDVETTNGGVHLNLPQSYAARVETGTVNGGFHSDFAQLSVDKSAKGYRTGGRVTADLNGGGAPVRAITTNGGVHIGAN